MINTLINIIKEHIAYKKQIGKLAMADLTKTYRGAALGWMWAIIKPTVTIFVYWFAFSIGLRMSSNVNGYPYFLWLIAGVVPWFYMSEMISGGTDAIRRYGYLVTKMKFPVSTIPTFVNISKLLVHCILVFIVIVIFRLFHRALDIYYLQIPFFMLLTFVFFELWGLLSAPLGAISKDYANLIKAFITAVFWLSGIMWNPETISNGTLKKFLMINPITYLVNGYRNCFINKVWFWEQPRRLLYFVVTCAVMLVLGLIIYRKLRKEIPDVL